MVLRVLSYNLRRLVSDVGREEIMRRIGELDADIIGLQEVDEKASLWGKVKWWGAKESLFSYFGNRGYDCVWNYTSLGSKLPEMIAQPFFTKKDGMMVLYKREKLEMDGKADQKVLGENFIMFWLGNERRVVQHVPLKFNGKRIDFFNTHLTYRTSKGMGKPSVREEQIKVLREFIEKKRKGIGILTGDFNMDDRNEGYKMVMENGKDSFRDANKKDEGYTWDTENTYVKRWMRRGVMPKLFSENRRIDFIFTFGNGIITKKSRVVLNEKCNGFHCSDHYGVLSEFEI